MKRRQQRGKGLALKEELEVKEKWREWMGG
jgi:hypothetical protein